MANVIFKGFNSIDKTRPFTEMTNQALIKRDILNHFNTRKGSRVMRPTYGCSLWDFIFEPLDGLTRDAILEDVNNVINSDSRVSIVSSSVDEYEHGIIVSFNLKYVLFDTIESFTVGFDRRNMSAQEIV